jgi:hypothetical protein
VIRNLAAAEIEAAGEFVCPEFILLGETAGEAARDIRWDSERLRPCTLSRV